MRRGERRRTRIRESIGRCVLVVRDTAHLLEGRRESRRRGKVIGAIARPLMSLQTREWNLILMTRAEGGGLGRIACPLMSHTLVRNLIMITGAARGDLGSECLQTRDRNLILMTRAEGGGLGRIACPLMSLLIQTRVRILILITREAGGDLGSIARLGI